MEQLREAASKILLSMAMQRGADALPPGPFAELLKMAAHFGQVPSCGTCKQLRKGTLSYCTNPPYQADEFQVDETHFCAEWNPEK